ncbi:oxygenase [Streptomyces sp. 840.1]|uniref:FAD-dependent monooxygenase n=1 Tax=Streptomyces sp. 840.1 TaxID=2485152 RepID=UPI000F49A7DA|nr:FAD-dependent monooxygenase [Streptomyces sp. 840.1]ROQ66588.1 oxygenase [Streptomyces sp. 840.1]
MPGDRLDTQVVVVGAGPVGLLLAGELRLGGARVVVLERRTAPTTESRASTLHARTMEILDSRGLLDGLPAPPNDPRGHFAGIPLDLALPGSRPGQWKVPQSDTERLLGRWAAGLGAEILRGHEVRAVTGTGGYVEAEAVGDGGPLLVRGTHLVACDGETSTVRDLIGADFPGHDARRELLRADVAGIEVPDRRFERLPDGLAIAARRADGVTRVMVHEHRAAAPHRTGAPEFGEVVQAWKRVTGEDISGGTPLWVNAFGDTARQLARYRHGRVLFAGDAAHRQLPIGGQALNLGLQDAFNLGWKLAAEVSGRAHPELLDSYHDERHPAGRRVLSAIEAQALLLLGGPEVEPLRALITELTGHEAVRAHLAATISGLDIRYDVKGPPHPLLGARLPLTPLAPPGPDGAATSTEALRTGRGLLLGPAGGPDPGPAPASVPGARDIPFATPAVPVPGRDGAGWTLVRPDGHVVWAGPSGALAEESLREALTRWFGPA